MANEEIWNKYSGNVCQCFIAESKQMQFAKHKRAASAEERKPSLCVYYTENEIAIHRTDEAL